MRKLIYMSEVSTWWTLGRQKDLLAELMPDAKLFFDELNRRKRSSHHIGSLIERAMMLQMLTRQTEGVEIHVASLAVLAWSESDLKDVSATITRGGGTLHWHDGVPASNAAAAWHLARAKTRLDSAMLRDTYVERLGRSTVYREACEAIRDRWQRPSSEWSTITLLTEVGLSRSTVNAYLGSRRQAQRIYKQRILSRT